MGKAIWLLAMGAALTVFGPSSPAPAAESAQVLMVDNEPDLTRWHFDPAEITVPAGATVVWVNKGKEDHTVTADDKSFDSGMKRSGASFQRVFPKPGRYSYHCAPHPWMKGTVQVLPAAAAAARSASEAPPASPATSAPAPPSTVITAPPTTTAAPTPAPTAAPPTSAPTEDGTADTGSSDDVAAGPAGSDDESGSRLPKTLAVVLVPTLAGLAVGAKLRQRSASASG